jgi:predicted nucleic acid-binding protein
MTTRLVLVDNTTLTNFALVARPELLLDLFGADCATTKAVMAEYHAGIVSRGMPLDSWEGLKQLVLQPIEQEFADQLPPQLGRGERSCLAIAIHRQALFVSDDAKARLVAQQHGVIVTGTIGVLVLNVRLGQLMLAEGNAILSRMIAQGYHSPVTVLDDLL